MTSDALARFSPRDWDLLRDQAKPTPFRRGETILEEGSHRRALLVIRSGAVRVERNEQGNGITIAQLGPGQVLGEMSFIENAPASASVVAETDGMIDVIEAESLHSVMAGEPGLAVRFYHSLAALLAARLRLTSSRLAQAGASEAAQVNRFRLARTGNLTARQLPTELSTELERFERTILRVDQRLRATHDAHGQGEGEVAAACDTVLGLLQRFMESDPLIEIGLDDLLAFRDTSQLATGVGDHVFRETFATFMLSATVARCYAKPRGFPDDYETIRTIYRNEPEGDGRLGPAIDHWFLERPICRSRRAARGQLRNLLESVANQAAAPFRVASLASGAAAELFDVLASPAGSGLLATCVDLDREALLASARIAEQNGLTGRLTFLHGNVLPVESQGAALLPQNVIYALGLSEYLDDEQLLTLLSRSYDNLIPGGTFAMTALLDSNPDRLFMEHVLDWKAYHRSPDALHDVLRRSPFGGQAVEILPDGTETSVLVRANRGSA